jgi:hypothetical protein
MNYDIILRYCKGLGWIGLVLVADKDYNFEEVYRTGIHHQDRAMAQYRVDEWISKHYDYEKGELNASF